MSVHTFGDVQVTSVANSSGGLRSSAVTVDFNPERYARKILDEEHERRIVTVWQEKCRNSTRVYDAEKFRLESFESSSGGANVRLGLTRYSELFGTEYADDSAAMVRAAKENGLDEYSYMSGALGVGAITVTSDNFVTLQVRAAWTGEGPGKLDRPGGHPEPANVSSKVGKPGVDLFTPDLVLEELFSSPQCELRDEVNIPLELQEEAELLGMVRDLAHGGRVGLDFLVKVKLTKEKVLERYSLGHQDEADESVRLVFFALPEIRDWTLDPNAVASMTAHCKGGLRLLHLMLNAQ